MNVWPFRAFGIYCGLAAGTYLAIYGADLAVRQGKKALAKAVVNGYARKMEKEYERRNNIVADVEFKEVG